MTGDTNTQETEETEQRPTQRDSWFGKRSVVLALVVLCIVGGQMVPLIAVGPADASAGSFVKEWQHYHHDSSSSGMEAIETANGVVFSAGRDNKVIAADATGGSKIWSHSNHSTSVLSMEVSGGTVFTGDGAGDIYAVDSSDGSEQWNSSHHSDNVRGLTESGGVIYSVGEDSKLYASSASTGAELWNKSLSASSWGIDESNGTLYVAVGDEVKALDASDGSVIWKKQYNSYTVGEVEANDGIVYSGDNFVIAANASNGNEIWNGSISKDVTGLSVKDDMLFAGALGGSVIAFDAQNGFKLASHNFHSQSVGSLDASKDKVFSGSAIDNTVIGAVSPTLFDITGEVVSSKTGDGIGQATVSVYNSTGGKVAQTTTDPTGSYTLAAPSGSQMEIEANHPDYVAERKTGITIDEDKQIDFELDPDKEGLILGTVIDNETGEVVSGAEVTVRENATQNVNGTDLTDSGGSYSIPVSNGTYDVTASRDGYSTETVVNVTVSGEEKQVNIRIDPHPFLEGTVTDAENKTEIEGATIQVFSEQGVEVNRTTTDEFGEYEINITDPADYTVHASADGYVNETRTNVTINRPIEEDFELTPKIEEIELEVRPHLEWNESTEYEVILTATTESGETQTFDVSGDSNTTVTSDDPGNLTVFESNNTVIAGNGHNVTTNLTAEYTTKDGEVLNDSESVVVAVESIDNVDILPVVVSIAVIISDTTVQTILIATGIGVAATLIATSTAGIGAFMLAFFASWLAGWLVTPIFGVGILMAGFTGLNVAQQVDYMRTR